MPRPPRWWDTIPLQARGCLALGSPGAPLTPETLGFPLGQAVPGVSGDLGHSGHPELIFRGCSVGNIPGWAYFDAGTKQIQWCPASAMPGAGCATGHRRWGCYGMAVAVACPRQQTSTLLFPSSSFHNAESN